MGVDERSELAAADVMEDLATRHSRGSLHVSAIIRDDGGKAQAWIECLECGAIFDLEKGRRAWKLAEGSELRLEREVCLSARGYEL